MHRRRFAQLLGTAALAPLCACRKAEPTPDALARLLGLTGTELRWLDRLTEAQQQELRSALERSDVARAVDLLFPLLGDRSRTFAFVGYPLVNDRRSVCDGLLIE